MPVSTTRLLYWLCINSCQTCTSQDAASPGVSRLASRVSPVHTGSSVMVSLTSVPEGKAVAVRAEHSSGQAQFSESWVEGREGCPEGTGQRRVSARG